MIVINHEHNRAVCCVLLLLIGQVGCTTFTGVKPMYPDVGHPNYHVPPVESMQPTLRGTSTSEAGATYDLAVLEGPDVHTEMLPLWWGKTAAKQIYMREGLAYPEHQIEEPLKPGKVYFWSVRSHGKGGTSEWSLYNYYLFTGLSLFLAHDQYFRFRTPNIDVQNE